MSLALCIHSSSTSVIPWIQPNTRLHTPAVLTTRKNSKYKSILAVQTCVVQRSTVGTSLVVQWLRLQPHFPLREMGSIPGQGTKNSHAAWHSQKKKSQLHFSKVLACDPGQVHSLCALCGHCFLQQEGRNSPQHYGQHPWLLGGLSHVTFALC